MIESIQQMDEECRALEAQTSDVRVESVGVAEKLNECVVNRDERLPASQCAALAARMQPPRAAMPVPYAPHIRAPLALRGCLTGRLPDWSPADAE